MLWRGDLPRRGELGAAALPQLRRPHDANETARVAAADAAAVARNSSLGLVSRSDESSSPGTHGDATTGSGYAPASCDVTFLIAGAQLSNSSHRRA